MMSALQSFEQDFYYLILDPGFARSFLAVGPMLVDPGELVFGMDDCM